MELKEIISEIQNSEIYSNWNKDNSQCYLVHVFKMLDKANMTEWQVGYYNTENRMITTFVYDEETKNITLNPESETFKKTESHIQELKLDNITSTYKEAEEILNKLKNEKYSAHPVDKAFFILQHLENLGIVWNFTLITKTMSVLNIKINAISKEVVEDKLTSIFEFKSN